MAAGGGAVGAVSRGCACLVPAQPVAKQAAQRERNPGRAAHVAKDSAPRFVGEPGAPEIHAVTDTNRLESYWNQESSALLSHADSCFSASSLAMP